MLPASALSKTRGRLQAGYTPPFGRRVSRVACFEYTQALREAAHFQLGRQLRDLFVTILASCRPADPRALWDLFRKELADDCFYQLRTIYEVSDPTQEQAEASRSAICTPCSSAATLI